MVGVRGIARTLFAAGILSGGAFISAQGLQESQSATTRASPPESGMGAICWAAILENGYQVASRCELGERTASDETLSAYAEARNKLGAEFLKSGWSEDALAKFRADQGGADAPTELLCSIDEASDTGKFLIDLAQAKPADIKATTESVLAIPGPPKWGTCL